MDGWILAQSLALFGNDLSKALLLFDEIRLPYYARMYAHFEGQRLKRAESLKKIETPGVGSLGREGRIWNEFMKMILAKLGKRLWGG